MLLNVCRACGRSIRSDASYCSTCGAANDNNALGQWLIVAAKVTVAMLAVFAVITVLNISLWDG
ncbi:MULTISPECIES: hypothetical protein [unclassified Methylobacterium]|uniref:hypothetical protein n=1 Tax=unclassified Methylobacterium TaxID=2615210 RepID=UPI002269D6D1|nr:MULTISPECIES: hypothetical protein [unclassified Methylobacterium]